MIATAEQQHTQTYAHCYASGVLQPVAHKQLVQNLPRIAKRAGIRDEYIYSPLPDELAGQRAMLVNFLAMAKDFKGFYTVGTGDPTLPSVITGVLIRNFIDARLMMLEDALGTVDAVADDMCTVLVIPDFFVHPNQLPDWKRGTVHRLLSKRMMLDKTTYLFGCPLAHTQIMGKEISALIKNNFKVL